MTKQQKIGAWILFPAIVLLLDHWATLVVIAATLPLLMHFPTTQEHDR
jgi:hypothetical protein